jgi:hypothetical protein
MQITSLPATSLVLPGGNGLHIFVPVFSPTPVRARVLPLIPARSFSHPVMTLVCYGHLHAISTENALAIHMTVLG